MADTIKVDFPDALLRADALDHYWAIYDDVSATLSKNPQVEVTGGAVTCDGGRNAYHGVPMHSFISRLALQTLQRDFPDDYALIRGAV